jgi:transposase-like protein
MDTSEQRTIETDTRVKRQRRSVEEKRRIVEETLGAGASVARVAQRPAINAKQVFAWRKRYRFALTHLESTHEARPFKMSAPAISLVAHKCG